LTADGEAAEPTETDEQAILHMLIPGARARIDGQLSDGDAVDSKALGILGVDAGAVALLVAVRSDLLSLWWLPAAALGVAGILLLAAVWPRTFDVGPDTRTFYETMGASTRLAASRQMLAELLAAIDVNETRLPGKKRLFKAGFRLLVIAIIGALAVAIAS